MSAPYLQMSVSLSQSKVGVVSQQLLLTYMVTGSTVTEATAEATVTATAEATATATAAPAFIVNVVIKLTNFDLFQVFIGQVNKLNKLFGELHMSSSLYVNIEPSPLDTGPEPGLH